MKTSALSFVFVDQIWSTKSKFDQLVTKVNVFLKPNFYTHIVCHTDSPRIDLHVLLCTIDSGCHYSLSISVVILEYRFHDTQAHLFLSKMDFKNAKMLPCLIITFSLWQDLRQRLQFSSLPLYVCLFFLTLIPLFLPELTAKLCWCKSICIHVSCLVFQPIHTGITVLLLVI